MTFADTMLAIESSSTQFDIFYKNCEAFIESASEDYIAEADKSSEGAVNKVGKAIKELIKKLKEFINGLIDKVTSFFSGNKETLSKAEKAAKENPKLKNTKVEMIDVDAIEKIYDKGINDIEKKLASAKSGNKSDVTSDIEAIVKSTEEEATKKKIKIVSLGALIAALTVGFGAYSKHKKPVEELEKEVTDGYDVESNPGDMEKNQNARTKAICKLLQKKGTATSSGLMSNFNNLKGVFTGEKESSNSNVGKANDYMFAEESTQLTEDNYDSYLESLMNIVDEEMTTEAYNAHLGKKMYLKNSKAKYDILKEKLEKVKNEDLDNDTKLEILKEASNIVTELLNEADKIPDDDFFDKIASINLILNGLKKAFAVFGAKFTVTKVVVFKPRTQRSTVVKQLRDYQHEIDKDIEKIDKTLKKEAKLAAIKEKIDNKDDAKTESVTVGEYLEGLENELFGESVEDEHIVTVGEYLESLEKELF